MFGAITSAVNHAWGVEKQRSFLKHRMVSFLMLLAAGATLLLTVILFSAGEVVETTWFAQVVERFPGLHTLAGFGVRYAATLMLIIGVGLVFYFIPNAKVRFRDVWVGAVITGLLWRGAYAGFAWYMRDLSRFSIHGSIGAVVAFMFWIYISVCDPAVRRGVHGGIRQTAATATGADTGRSLASGLRAARCRSQQMHNAPTSASFYRGILTALLPPGFLIRRAEPRCATHAARVAVHRAARASWPRDLRTRTPAAAPGRGRTASRSSTYPRRGRRPPGPAH